MTNAGYDAGIAKHNKKERLAWTLKAAPLRTKDLKLTPIGALAEGRKLRESITEKLIKSGIDPQEAVIGIVFAKPNLSAIVPQFPIIQVTPSPALEAEHAGKFADCVPIGFLVFIWDKEDQKIFGHVRPLMVQDPRSLTLNAQALRVFERVVKRRVFGEGANG